MILRVRRSSRSSRTNGIPAVALALLMALGYVSTVASRDRAPTVAPVDALRVLGGRIFFARAGGVFGDETLFEMAADGSNERRITEPGAFCCQAVSPDGTHILVMTDDQVEGFPVGGGTIRLADGAYTRIPLVINGLNLVPQAWSSDGSHAAFEGWVDANPHRTGVYTARISDGRDLKRLTNPGSDPDVHDIPADWSPEGSEIVLFRSGPPGSGSWDLGGSLWVVNTRTGSEHRLDLGAVSPSWWARWSPDADRILFGSARLAEHGAIWTIRRDGSDLTKVFEDPSGGWPVTPAWSPDGTRIVFALDPVADEFSHPVNVVYTIRSDGTDLTMLLAGDDHKRRFDWVP